MKSNYLGGAGLVLACALVASACGDDDVAETDPGGAPSGPDASMVAEAGRNDADATPAPDAGSLACGDHAHESGGVCACDAGFYHDGTTCTIQAAIAFVSERSGNDELYTMAIDGSHVVQLTDSPGFDRAPAFSPDGTHLAFNSRRAPHEDRPEIYRLDLSSGVSSRVTVSEVENHRASFSPDGNALIYQSGTFANGYRLLRRELTSGVERELQGWPGKWVAAGSLSPDGSQLAFQSNHESTDMFPFRLYVRSFASEAVTELAAHADGSIDGPRWSPDGTQLVFSSSRDANGTHLYLVDVASGATTQLTEGEVNDSAPAFSPDGDALVFQSDRQDEDGGIHVIELRTRTIRYLGEGRTPVWSPRR